MRTTYVVLKAIHSQCFLIEWPRPYMWFARDQQITFRKVFKTRTADVSTELWNRTEPCPSWLHFSSKYGFVFLWPWCLLLFTCCSAPVCLPHKSHNMSPHSVSSLLSQLASGRTGKTDIVGGETALFNVSFSNEISNQMKKQAWNYAHPVFTVDTSLPRSSSWLRATVLSHWLYTQWLFYKRTVAESG